MDLADLIITVLYAQEEVASEANNYTIFDIDNKPHFIVGGTKFNPQHINACRSRQQLVELLEPFTGVTPVMDRAISFHQQATSVLPIPFIAMLMPNGGAIGDAFRGAMRILRKELSELRDFYLRTLNDKVLLEISTEEPIVKMVVAMIDVRLRNGKVLISPICLNRITHPGPVMHDCLALIIAISLSVASRIY